MPEEEKFSCPDCGFKMSMAELDSHPAQCKVKKGKCEFCHSEYPLELLKEHYSYCEQKKTQQNHRAQNTRERGYSQPRERRNQR